VRIIAGTAVKIVQIDVNQVLGQQLEKIKFKVKWRQNLNLVRLPIPPHPHPCLSGERWFPLSWWGLSKDFSGMREEIVT